MEQQPQLGLVIALCLWKLARLVLDQTFLFFFLEEQIMFKSVILHFFIRFSAGDDKSRGRVRKQVILVNGRWHSKYIIDKSTNYSATSTDWTLSNM